MHRVLATCLPLLLFGCSPPLRVIDAVVENGAIVFKARSQGLLPFPRYVAITIDDRLSVTSPDGMVWGIYRKPDCHTTAPTLPLRYGQIPECFVERKNAAKLRRGTPYRVRNGFSNGLRAEGYFQIDGKVTNYSMEQISSRLSSFPFEDEVMSRTPPADTNLLSDNVILEVPAE